MARPLRIFGWIVLLGIAGLFALVVLVLQPSKSRTDAVNREEADRVVNALEAFHRARNSYPAGLSELTPQFIPRLPQQRNLRGEQRPFHYEPHGSAYILSYDEAPLGPFPSDSAFQYDSKTRQWQHKTY